MHADPRPSKNGCWSPGFFEARLVIARSLRLARHPIETYETQAWVLRVDRAPKRHISSKKRVGIYHINPLIMKPYKVGISLKIAYAYVLFGVPELRV